MNTFIATDLVRGLNYFDTSRSLSFVENEIGLN